MWHRRGGRARRRGARRARLAQDEPAEQAGYYRAGCAGGLGALGGTRDFVERRRHSRRVRSADESRARVARRRRRGRVAGAVRAVARPAHPGGRRIG